MTHRSFGVGRTGAVKPSRIRGQDEAFASILTGVRQTGVWERDGHLHTSYLKAVECVLVFLLSVSKQKVVFVCVCLCATELNRESKWWKGWARERELSAAESPLPLMLAWHVTFPDAHVHTVLRSTCQRWPSSTSRPSHTHRCLTHSHPSR